MDSNYSWIWWIVFISALWFWQSHHDEKMRDEGYNSGYSDGYDNGYIKGQQEPLYPEDITREHVNQNPEQYCYDYAKERFERAMSKLELDYICYRR